MSDKTENTRPANGMLEAKEKGKMPKKCPWCGTHDILEGDGGDWCYCNNCSWKAFYKDLADK